MLAEESFSFDYGDRPFPEGFARSEANGNVVFTHPDGLQVTVREERYTDTGALEWTLWFENCGEDRSRQLTRIDALDARIDAPSGGYVVSTTKGSLDEPDDFVYQAYPARRGEEVTLRARGSGEHIPFANVDCGGEGMFIAVGWTGDWFIRVESEGDHLRLTGGMPDVDFYLEPGEHVRSPRILLMPWKGRLIDAHNAFRRHMVAHHLPKGPDGKPQTLICCNSWGGMKTARHLSLIDYIRRNGFKYDCYWIDAGWQGPDHECEEYQNMLTEDWAYNRGEWRVNRLVHPDGLMPVSSAAHTAGMKLLLWCGAFNCNTDMGWYLEHPEWGKLQQPRPMGRNPKLCHTATIYMDDPEAMDWLGERIARLMKENGADFYREDTALPDGHDDPEGRKGIGQMKAVETFYAYWDKLRSENPGLIIDNCGGGGRRIDLETLSRSYVFWRTDVYCDPDADPICAQVGNHGLGHWFPMVAAPVGKKTPDSAGAYAFRSGISGVSILSLLKISGFGSGETEVPENYPVAWHRKMLDDFQRVKDYTWGDFYPLSDCDTRTDSYLAYQMDRPDLGEGCVQAFRRQDCTHERFEVVPELEAGASYAFTDLDSGETTVLRAGEALALTIGERPGSLLLVYKKLA